MSLLIFSGIASAHVTVQPKETTQGSYEKFTVRVPSEKKDAATVKVEVKFRNKVPSVDLEVVLLDSKGKTVGSRSLRCGNNEMLRKAHTPGPMRESLSLINSETLGVPVSKKKLDDITRVKLTFAMVPGPAHNLERLDSAPRSPGDP